MVIGSVIITKRRPLEMVFHGIHGSSCDARNVKRKRRRANRNKNNNEENDIGTVAEVNKVKEMIMWDGQVMEGTEVTIHSPLAVSDATLGCSIAVNGVCLTVISFDKEKFTVGVSPETLRRSNLCSLDKGSKVNIERALPANGRNSGHFVQGHVDQKAILRDRWVEGDSIWFKIQPEEEYLPYIVPKGFIAIDGVSLTVCEVYKGKQQQPSSSSSSSSSSSQAEGGGVRGGDFSWFTVMMIPHTQQHVTLPMKEVGSLVNIEVDVLGKMVQNAIQAHLNQVDSDRQGSGSSGSSGYQQEEIDNLKSEIEQLKETIFALSKRIHMVEEKDV
eukprot:scaffold4275_cov179-Ochromonas_danica.AAC.7